MKLTNLLFLISALNVFGGITYSQNAKLNLDLKDVPILTVLSEIENQSQFFFLYSPKMIDVTQKVNVYAESKNINEVLDNILSKTEIKYTVRDRQILLMKNIKTEAVSEQQRTITGTIADAETKEPMIGVNIQVKGTTMGVISDASGQYSLSVPSQNDILVFSFIGYTTQEVNIGNRSVVNIGLSAELTGLNEVVVIGYGSVRKADLTGSVGSVTTESLKEVKVTTVGQALLGKVAGVQIKQADGAPGAPPEIIIRGVGSMAGGTSPLYVVDGFPVSDLQSINPENIESIDILKDASATAIYGSRGSNGVIIVNTKRGQAGSNQISFDVSAGFQSISKKPVYLTAYEQAKSAYWGAYNRNIDLAADVSGDPRTWRLKVPQIALDILAGKTTPTNPEIYGSTMPNTDWLDLILRVAPVQSYQLSSSGGNENLKYSISGEYLNQDGIIINTNYKRYSLQANIDGQLTKRLAIKVNLNPSHTVDIGGDPSGVGYGTGAVSNANSISAYTPAYAPNGDYFVLSGYEETGNYPNAVALAKEIIDNETGSRFRGNIVSEYSILDELKFNIMLGGSFITDRRQFFQPQLPSFLNAKATGQEWTNIGSNWINEYTLNYNKIFGKHRLVGLAGMTAERSKIESNSLSSNAYANNLVPYMSAAGGIFTGGTSTIGEWSMVSYLARINYTYDDRYYITTSFRTDGSSRFGSEKRYGVFPSGALAWRISQEEFMNSVSFVSNLKVRASYGQTGNNNIGNYASLATVSNVNYPMGGIPTAGFFEARIYNPELTWEKQSSFDLGMDLGFFNDRVTITADYFITRNKSLLLNVNIPTITGFNTALQNIGEVENKGMELVLNTVNVKGKFEWSTDFNLSAYRNKVLALGPEGDPIISDHHKTEVGQPIGMFYGLVMDGIFESTEELAQGPIYNPGASNRTRVGDIKFKDFSGPNGSPDGIINSYDRVYMGSPHPDFYYGMTNNFSYKNISLAVSLQGVVGNEIYSLVRVTSLRSSYRRKILGEGRDFWISEAEPGDGQTPRQNDEPSGGIREASSLFLEDGSYLRINNIALNYTLPGEIAQRLKLNSVRFYVNASNPFLFSKTSGFNPDVTRSSNPLQPGEDNNQYPLAKSIRLGINLGF